MDKENKNSIIKRIKKAFKKRTEIEKEKSKLKKIKKKNRPRGYTARMAGSITFWVLFGFMFLVVFINVFSSSDDVPLDIEISKAERSEAVDFSKEVLFYLFNNDDKIHDEREFKLESFSVDNINLDEFIAFDQEWEMSLNKNDIILKDIIVTDENSSRFVFNINLNLKRDYTDEELKEIKEDEYKFFSDKEKELEEDLEEQEQEMFDIKTIYTNKYEQKIISLYIDLPLILIDNELFVSNYPSFTYYKPDEVEGKKYTSLDKLSEVQDEEKSIEIEEFLQTFFTSFSNDSKEALSYFLDDDRFVNGLNRTLKFERVEEFTLYEGKGDDIFVDTLVYFSQPNTGLEVKTNYQLVIYLKGNRYVVKYINNDKYLDELIHGVSSDTETEVESVIDDFDESDEEVLEEKLEEENKSTIKENEKDINDKDDDVLKDENKTKEKQDDKKNVKKQKNKSDDK